MRARAPARDKEAAADFLREFSAKGRSGHFAPVRVNGALTLRFEDNVSFNSHHDAFHVGDAEFDAILGRVQEAGLAYGGAPWRADDGDLNDWNGGRGVYFGTPDGHLLELMTAPR